MVRSPDKTLDGKVAFVGGASRNLGGLISTPLYHPLTGGQQA
ncbi:hypothetical protein ABZX39_25135 [Streptomyces collinus]